MSHIHLPDGALPGNIVFIGLMLTFGLLILATRRIRKEQLVEYMPRMAFISAMLLIVMSIPLGFLPIHANLSVLAGIMLGPWLGIFSAFIVNMFLAFVGHGTTAMVGINTLVMSAEMILGYLVVIGLLRYCSHRTAAAIAVILTLVLTSTTALWGMHSMGLEVDALLHHDHDHDHEHGASYTGAPAAVNAHDDHNHGGLWYALPILMVFVAPAVALETVLTFLIVGLLMRVRPQMFMAQRSK